MPLQCAKCNRANPGDAKYCYYDGIALDGKVGGGPVAIGMQPFTSPFTLPNGKSCGNFDQLALNCQQNWSSAVESLKQGALEKFMAAQGRADLAQAAREAARFPDKDRGLDQFLAKLPSQAVQPPKLSVEPMELNLGQLKFGDSKTVQLKMRNQGMRLVYGSVAVDNAPWLTLGSGAGSNQKLFQFGSDLSIPVNIQGKRLRASNKPLEGRLIVDSNAGVFTIPIKAEVPVKPFPSGSLAGARSPRQIAEKAKANPKESASLFENGTVAQWYKDNGWTYPVKGVSASGLGAVQQFFEALGLTPPPKVDVNQRAVNFKGDPGQSLRETLEIKAQEKRPVYAHATADQPWLEVGRARLNGRVATIPLTVSNVPAREGEVLKAKVVITANGNQRFVVPVTLTIGSGGNFLAAAPLVFTGGGAAAPVIASTRAGKARGGPVNLLPLLLLLLALTGVLIWDLVGLFGSKAQIVDPGKDPDQMIEGPAGPTGPTPYDEKARIGLVFNDETQRFGLTVLALEDPRYPGKPKKLTRNEDGMTSNFCIDVEGYQYLFGRESKGAGWTWARDERGKQVKNRASKDGKSYETWMKLEGENIMVKRTVKLIVGESTRLYDTVLVKYEVTNNDTRVHTIGVREMIDTFIGANDGTPFFIPPTEDVQQDRLVDTMIRLEKEKIPQFVRVMEFAPGVNDAQNTIAEMGVRLGGKYEAPKELVICHWPQQQGASEAKWDWKFEAMNFPPDQEKDSCVVIYWSKNNMRPKRGTQPGETRVFGYTYGLGRMPKEKEIAEEARLSKGKIRLFCSAGSKKNPFVATATIRNGDGQNVTIKLPPDVKLVEGQSATKPVKTEAGKEYATVSWRLKCSKVGEYTLHAALDDGAEAKAEVNVPDSSIFDGK